MIIFFMILFLRCERIFQRDKGESFNSGKRYTIIEKSYIIHTLINQFSAAQKKYNMKAAPITIGTALFSCLSLSVAGINFNT